MAAMCGCVLDVVEIDCPGRALHASGRDWSVHDDVGDRQGPLACLPSPNTRNSRSRMGQVGTVVVDQERLVPCGHVS